MSNDNWNDDFQQDSFDQEYEPAGRTPRKQGMSTGVKVLLILLAVFGAGGLLCCGGMAYFVYQFVPTVSERPEEIIAAQKEIADFEVPENLKPKLSMSWDNFMFLMNLVQFESDDASTKLMLLQLHAKVGGQAEQEIQMRQALREQGETADGPLKGEETTTRMLTVKGVEQEFSFSSGEDPATGRKVRRVSGSFPGKTGQVELTYQTEEDSYNEEEVVKMIESIQ